MLMHKNIIVNFFFSLTIEMSWFSSKMRSYFKEDTVNPLNNQNAFEVYSIFCLLRVLPTSIEFSGDCKKLVKPHH